MGAGTNTPCRVFVNLGKGPKGTTRKSTNLIHSVFVQGSGSVHGPGWLWECNRKIDEYDLEIILLSKV